MSSLGVIYCASHGISFLFSARVGISVAGGGDCALYSPAAGHVLDFHHLVSGMDWSGGLHCGGSHSRCGAAAGVVSGIPAAAEASVTVYSLGIERRAARIIAGWT